MFVSSHAPCRVRVRQSVGVDGRDEVEKNLYDDGAMGKSYGHERLGSEAEAEVLGGITQGLYSPKLCRNSS